MITVQHQYIERLNSTPDRVRVMRLSEPLRHFHQNVQNAAFVENLVKPTSKLYIIGKAERVETVFDFVESWVSLVNRRE